MKKVYILISLLLCCVSCKNIHDGKNSNNSDSKKTAVQIQNNTDFKIGVYLDSQGKELLTELNAGASCTKNVEYFDTGNVFYYTYYFDVGSIFLPYGKAVNIVKLIQNSNNSIIIQNQPTEVFQNKVILVLENASESNAIVLKNINSEIIPESKDSPFIPVGESAVYVIDSLSVDDISKYQIVDGTKTISFGVLTTFNTGSIYSLRYSPNKTISVLSITPLDISIKSKIWKIPLSQTTGKFLFSDTFGLRENVDEGYYLTGQLSFNKESISVQSKPYIAQITPNGEITDNLVTFKDNPLNVESDFFIEKDKKLIVGGKKVNQNSEVVPFLYGDNQCNFYIEPELENFDYFVGIINKNTDVFSILYGNKDSEGFSIYDMIISDYNTVTLEKIYSTTEECNPWGFIYSDNGYVVLSQSETGSIFSFISDEGLLVNTKEKTGYYFNAIKCKNNYAFASGSYSNAITGKDIASFVQIDLVSKDFYKPESKKLFPSTRENMNSNFTYMSINNNELYLAGFIDRDYAVDPYSYSSGYPYMIGYSIESEEILWEQVYKEYEEYAIWECSLSSIGTPLIELFNENNYKSYIVSCGLRGEIPEKELPPLPRNPNIPYVNNP